MVRLFGKVLGVTFLLWLAAVQTQTQAQTWPVKPVKVIVPTPPGPVPDIMARLMTERLSHSLGQQFVVENLAGASGIIGAQAAARAAPDGYTFFFGPASSLATNMFLFKSIPYDPVRDFTPVALVADTNPFLVSASADVPVKSMAELIALAKQKPGGQFYAVSASSGIAAIIGKLLNKRAAISMVEVSYKANAQAIQDMVTGRIQFMISTMPEMESFVKAGKLRRLAVTGPRRFPGMEDVPTLGETLPGLVVDGWMAVVAPTGTPANIVQRLNEEIDVFTRDPEIMKRMNAFGLATTGAGTPRSTGEFMRKERDRWSELIKELNLQPQ